MALIKLIPLVRSWMIFELLLSLHCRGKERHSAREDLLSSSAFYTFSFEQQSLCMTFFDRYWFANQFKAALHMENHILSLGKVGELSIFL